MLPSTIDRSVPADILIKRDAIERKLSDLYCKTSLGGQNFKRPPPIIGVVAENFGLADDNSEYLSLRTPLFRDAPKKLLINFGHHPSWLKITPEWKLESLNLLDKDKLHDLQQLDQFSESRDESERLFVFVNNLSELELRATSDSDATEFLKFVFQKRYNNCAFVIFYQNTHYNCGSKVLQTLEYISDAMIRAKYDGDKLLESLWIKPHYNNVGSDWAIYLATSKDKKSEVITKEQFNLVNKVDWLVKENQTIENELGHCSDEDDDLTTSTLPHVEAQNPERSRIFYYPDKDDDIDEDDPDNDLSI